jgi:hypothetical protein
MQQIACHKIIIFNNHITIVIMGNSQITIAYNMLTINYLPFYAILCK